MQPVRISHSSSTKYNDCSESYNLHYNQRIRPIKNKSSLVFGGAIDVGLNALLEGKSREEAEAIFIDRMTNIEVNGVKIDLSVTPDAISYSKKDFDEILGGSPRESLIAKGKLMIRDYERKVMPKFKSIISVQEPTKVGNEEGDSVQGYLDIIADWEDGSRYLLDNKTTSVKYAPDSAGKAPQLILYFEAEKNKFKLDRVGFITLNKDVQHNEQKICKVCKNDGSGSRHKTCNETHGKTRCNGEWDITYDPEIEINFILNDVNPTALAETFEALDKTNHGITNGVYEQNRKACFGKFGKCPYYSYCRDGSMHGLTVVEKTEK